MNCEGNYGGCSSLLHVFTIFHHIVRVNVVTLAGQISSPYLHLSQELIIFYKKKQPKSGHSHYLLPYMATFHGHCHHYCLCYSSKDRVSVQDLTSVVTTVTDIIIL